MFVQTICGPFKKIFNKNEKHIENKMAFFLVKC